MKKQIISLATMLLVVNSHAQNSSTTQVVQADQTVSSEGIRVGVFKPLLSAIVKIDADGVPTNETTEEIDDSIGLSLGYASLPANSIGWTANASLIELKESSETVQMARVDGNVAYSLGYRMNVKTGLNLTKFTKNANDNTTADYKKLDPELGFQLGMGFQISKNFSVEAAYTEMKQKGAISIFDDEIVVKNKFSGLEIGLTGTF